MNAEEFKKVIYALGNDIGASVETFYFPGVTPNFQVCKLMINSNAIFVLCSENGDWCVSKSFDESLCELEFTDNELITKSLNVQFGIILLSKQELNQEFSSRSYLSDCDVKYWKPRSLGDGLFNWWN